MKSLDEVDRVTVQEYQWLMEARQYRDVDDNYYLHRQAFANMAVTARRKNGSPVYTHFQKFYDYEKDLRRLKEQDTTPDEKSRKIFEILQKGGQE